MKDKLTILKYPLFLWLLPVFFVLHGVMENYDFVSFKDAATLTLTYLGFSLLFLIIFRMFYRNWLKASLMSFLLMTFNFFFGSIYDGLKKISANAFFTKYSILLPAVFIIFLFIIIYIKKRKQPPVKISLYLNTLFLLLIVIDTAILISKYFSLRKERKMSVAKSFIPGNLSPNPDIYFIILDEYAGHKQLEDQLGYDNTGFENELRQKKFLVLNNSTSNYISTPLSVASFLNMNYLDLKGIDQEQDRVLHSYRQIRQSSLLLYFVSRGYDIYNLSIFDLSGQKAFTRPTFLPTGKKLITSQTFVDRVETNLGFHLYTTLGFKQNIEKDIYLDLQNNNDLYDRSFRLASAKTEKPKFVYTHLMMPHYPYYFTKTGKQRPLEELLVKNKTNPEYYLEYLSYCNEKALALVAEIQKNSPETIIILAGDHGFRAFENKVDQRYLFYNLCAVYLPSQNYSRFYDGLSSVNLFRTILNTEFQQQLPLLPDSCIINTQRTSNDKNESE